MKLNYLPYLIFTSFSLATSAHACNVDMLIAKQQIDANMQSFAIDSNTFQLSKNTFKHYCLFQGATSETKHKALLVHKKTGEVHTFNNFFAVKQSPNSAYIAVATSDVPTISADSTGSINKITILDRKGVVNFGQRFDHGIFVELFEFRFSADSRYLNFYSVEESSITYHTLDIKTGELHKDVASGDMYQNLLTSRNETSESYFSFFVPVNNNEFAAMTSNEYIGYYKNQQPVWIKNLGKKHDTSRLIDVGQIYIVLLNASGGLEFFRKSDGKQYKIIQLVSEDFYKPSFEYLDSSFIDTHKMALTYRVSGTHRPVTVIIDFEKRVSIKP